MNLFLIYFLDFIMILLTDIDYPKHHLIETNRFLFIVQGHLKKWTATVVFFAHFIKLLYLLLLLCIVIFSKAFHRNLIQKLVFLLNITARVEKEMITKKEVPSINLP